MSNSDTRQRILRTLRKTEEPALSAADLAEELQVSVKTVNNNVTSLIDDDEIATTQIGNATAYYIEPEDLPAHSKPEHTCKRCGRDASGTNDQARIDTETYFVGQNREPSTLDFYVLCRFCYADLVRWLHNDDGAMGNYPFAHSWEIPESQLRDVRDNPNIESAPDRTDVYVDEYKQMAAEVLNSLVDDPDEPISKSKLRSRLNEELSPRKAKKAYAYLESTGHFYDRNTHDELLPAK
jgi:hypothetical protein